MTHFFKQKLSQQKKERPIQFTLLNSIIGNTSSSPLPSSLSLSLSTSLLSSTNSNEPLHKQREQKQLSKIHFSTHNPAPLWQFRVVTLLYCSVALTLLQFYLNCANADNNLTRNLIGVPPDKRAQYEISADGTFKCLDGSASISFEAVNDDYCDCRDASDEPGTAACPHGRFHCKNANYIPQSIPAGWVDDTRCDCCDGSDERNSGAQCENTCYALGEQWRIEQEKFKAIAEQGAAVRSQYKELAKKKKEESNQLLEQYKRELAEKDNAIKRLEEDMSADFGPDLVFYPLKGECFKFTDREYTYSLCPFDRAVQESQNGMHTDLGHWAGWAGPQDNIYLAQKYEGGLQCWNGPARSTVVSITCGAENKVVSVSEPSRCEYTFEFVSPAACPDLDPPTEAPAIEATKAHIEIEEHLPNSGLDDEGEGETIDGVHDAALAEEHREHNQQQEGGEKHDEL